MSSLLRRMHPLLTNWPMRSGRFVPWIAIWPGAAVEALQHVGECRHAQLEGAVGALRLGELHHDVDEEVPQRCRRLRRSRRHRRLEQHLIGRALVHREPARLALDHDPVVDATQADVRPRGSTQWLSFGRRGICTCTQPGGPCAFTRNASGTCSTVGLGSEPVGSAAPGASYKLHLGHDGVGCFERVRRASWSSSWWSWSWARCRGGGRASTRVVALPPLGHSTTPATIASAATTQAIPIRTRIGRKDRSARARQRDRPTGRRTGRRGAASWSSSAPKSA